MFGSEVRARCAAHVARATCVFVFALARAAHAEAPTPAAESDPELNAATTLSWSKDPTDLASAEQKLSLYLSKHPGSAAARLQRARVRAWLGRTHDAAEDYREYLKGHANEDAIVLEFARALSWGKQPEDRQASLPLFEQYVSRHPTDIDARLARARAYVWTGKHAQADADYRVCVEKRPNDDALLLEWAQATFQGPTPGDSIPLFDRYLSRHGLDVEARIARAKALLWSGEYGKAESALDELRSEKRFAKPELRDAVDLEVARLYAQTARRQAACDLLEEILARNPDSKDAKAELERASIPLHSRIEPSFTFYADKSSILVLSTALDGRIALSRNVGILLNTTGFSLGTSAETLLAARASMGAFAIYKSLELEALVGPRFYEYFTPNVGTAARVKFTPIPELRLGANYQYDDIYFDMLQPASISAGIRGHALFATADASLPLGIRVTGRVGTRQLAPENHGVDASGTLLVKLVGPLSAGYNGQFIAWTANDPAYWSPQAFAAHLGIVRLAGSLDHAKFGYDAQAVLGVAGERIAKAPDVGYGISFGGSGAISYEAHPHLMLRLGLQYSQTVRSIPKVPVGGTSSTLEGEDEELESRYWWLAGTASATVYF